MDWLTNWPEAFEEPDKKAQTVAALLLTKIIPCFRTPLELVFDNGPVNVNEIMRLENLNIKHIVTSSYHPQSNAKLERFHHFLGATRTKLSDGEKGNWNLFLTQAWGTIRFSLNEVIRFSPYFWLFGRDIILPIDNLLKPSRKYVGEHFHRMILQHEHKIVMQAKQRIKRAQKERWNDKRE